MHEHSTNPPSSPDTHPQIRSEHRDAREVLDALFASQSFARREPDEDATFLVGGPRVTGSFF